MRILSGPLAWPRLTLALLALATAALALQLPRLRRDVRVEKVFPEGDPRIGDYRAFQAAFGRDDADAVVVVELGGEDVLARPALERIHALTEGLRALASVDAERVVSLSHAAFARARGAEVDVAPLFTPGQASTWTPAQVMAHPAFDQRLLSRDRRLCAFLVPLHPLQGSVDERREFAATLRRYFSPEGALHAGERAWLDGQLVSNDAILSLIQDDARRFLPLAFGLVFLVIGLALRHALAALLALAAVGLAALWTLGAMAALDLPLSFMSTTVPVMVLVAGVGDAVHLLARHRQLLAKLPRAEAARVAVEEVGPACLFTSLTTAAGFASLLGSRIEIVRELGGPVALGVLLAFVVTFALLPPLLRWVPLSPAPAAGPARAFGALATWVEGRAGRVVAAALLLVGLAAALLPQVPRETQLLQDFAEDEPLVVTRRLLEERMGGVAPLELVVDAGAPGAALEPGLQRGLLALADALRGERFRQAGVLAAITLPDYLREVHRLWSPGAGDLPATPKGIAQLRFLYGLAGEDPTRALVDDQDAPRRVRLSLRLENLRTRAFFALCEAIRAEAAARLPAGTQVTLTGMTLMAHTVSQAVVREMLSSLGTAALAIGALLWLCCGSLRLALCGLAASAAPLVLVGGLLALTRTTLSLSASVVFAIAFGLAVDDSIHVVMGLGQRGGRLAETLAETGQALVLSSAALAAGFGVLVVSHFHANRTFGMLVAVTATLALVCDLVLLPALVSLSAPRAPSDPAAAPAPSGSGGPR
ncbi:MAG: RND family transporter [Planctomycetota bacterium]